MIEDFVCNVILWIISFLMFRLNETFWRRCKKLCLRTSSNSFYVDFVFILLKVKILLYYIVPSITRFFFQWENDYIDRVMPYEVCIVYLAELVALFVYDNTFLYFLKNNKRDLSFNSKGTTTTKLFAYLILVLFVFFTITKMDALGSENGPSDELWMLRPLMTTVGATLCFYILPMGKKYWDIPIIIFALVTTIIYLITGFYSGIRGTIFWPILWLFYCAFYFNKKRGIKKRGNKKMLSIWVGVGLAVLILLAVLQGGMTATRSSDAIDVVMKINEISSRKDDGSRPFFKEIDFRFGASTHYSVGFYRLYNKNEDAGLKPIINSMYAPIPRRFMPDKPVPCSVDGDLYGMGMYKTYDEVKPGFYNMSEFSTAAHAYWELGIFGIIIFSIIPAIYVFYSIKLFRQFDLLGPCFFLAIFKPWGYNEPKIWVSEIVLQLSQVILVSFVLLFIYKRLKTVLK